MIRLVKIWFEGEKYALRQNDGTFTVNNSECRYRILLFKLGIIQELK